MITLQRTRHIFLIVLFSLCIPLFLFGQESQSDKAALVQHMHTISSHDLFDYVKEQCKEKYGGRLTGTDEYQAAAEWVASMFAQWGLKPVGDNGTYFQWFDIPYTLVFPDCHVQLHIPQKEGVIKKHYRYQDEYMPGSTSASGEVTAEVVYAGYGITAPELGYDDYKGIDVKGKIVLIEREVPVSPRSDAEKFKKWRPYSFHQYKHENAVKHGARGMLYNYGPIANPNNAYDERLIYSHVGDSVVKDIFSGTGKDHGEVLQKIKDQLKPQSFRTKKIVSIKNTTEYHPEGRGTNVVALFEGSDPVLKNEIIMIGGHLDHMGRCYELIQGANDNASAVAVMLGLAEALSTSPIKPKRSILFNCFGAEEQAVVGSKYYLENPIYPLEKTLCLINMDGVGVGDKLGATAAENFPEFWAFFDEANEQYIHRTIRTNYFSNLARPRLDAARFLWANVPTISYYAFGGRSYYHIPKDNVDTITPEIMQDLTQLIFLAVTEMANQDDLDFRKK